MRKIERFDKYMKYKNLNDNKVTVQLGLSVGTLGKSRKEGRDISDKVIEQILNFYTDLNRTWLLTGDGDMLNASVKPQTYYGGEVDQSNVNGDNIQGNHVTVNKYVEELMERLKSRDEALMKAQEQMSKAQEQMDRLLAIIDNLTRQH